MVDYLAKSLPSREDVLQLSDADGSVGWVLVLNVCHDFNYKHNGNLRAGQMLLTVRTDISAKLTREK